MKFAGLIAVLLGCANLFFWEHPFNAFVAGTCLTIGIIAILDWSRERA